MTVCDGAERLGEGREAEILAWGDGRALRLLRDPEAGDRVRLEAAAMTAARTAGVSVPEVLEIVTVDGQPGLVMERVEGVDLFTGLARRPWRLAGTARALGRLQAGLHDTAAPAGLPELRPMLRRRIAAVPNLSRRARAHALGELQRLPDRDRLCHGDFHPGNIIASARGPVIIDWANAARGDPMADLARTVLMLRVAPLPPAMSPMLRCVDRVGRSTFRRLWLGGYRRVRPIDGGLVARWQTVCAAARLLDAIEEEVPALLALVEGSARA